MKQSLPTHFLFRSNLSHFQKFSCFHGENAKYAGLYLFVLTLRDSIVAAMLYYWWHVCASGRNDFFHQKRLLHCLF